MSDGSEDLDAIIAAALAAYGRSEYFGAHELFERAWLGSGSPRSLELHALAQLAAAMHKHRAQRKPDAARAILARAREKLGRIDASGYGIDLRALRDGIDRWLLDPSAPPPLPSRAAPRRG